MTPQTGCEKPTWHGAHRHRWFAATDTDLPLIATWSAIAGSTALLGGAYSVAAVTLVSMATLILAFLTIVGSRPQRSRDEHAVFGVAIAVVVFAALVHTDSSPYASGSQLYLSHTITALLAILVAGMFIFRVPVPRLVSYILIALMFWAGVAMVLADPNPFIDVWYELQAAANGLSHGQSMYTLHWFAPPGQDSNAFSYFPGCAVFLWPFYLVTHDVRYGELVAFVLTALILMRARGGRSGTMLGCLAVLYPAGLYGIGQAWIDPVVLFEISAAAYACTRGHKRIAMLAFGAALVSKQYVWLLVPLAVVWEDFGWRRTAITVGGAVTFLLPWYLVAPAGFVEGTLLYNLRYPARLTSLSLFTTAVLHHWHAYFAVTAVATVAAIGLALWRGAKDTKGFLVSSAFVMATFNLANKQSFFNEWELVAGLALAAIAFSGGNHKIEAPRPRFPGCSLRDRVRRRALQAMQRAWSSLAQAGHSLQRSRVSRELSTTVPEVIDDQPTST